MRSLILLLFLTWAATFLGTVSAVDAAPNVPAPPSPLIHYQEIDDNDDTRVEVQVAVLATVFGVVFVLGTVLYFVRRRAGLVPPPPDPAATQEQH